MVPTAVAASPRGRVQALDGVRGVAIVLVVLGHGSLIWPKAEVETVPYLSGIFHGGTVVLFFVIGGFIVTRGLLRERDRETLDPPRFYLRRIVRLGVQLVPLAIAIIAIHQLDPTDPNTTESTRGSLVAILTHTWNVYVADNLLEARSDVGHLWFLSVQQQVYLVLPLAIALLGSRRRLLVRILLVLAAAAVVNRYHVLADQGWVLATLQTTTRSDGVLIGAALAVAWPTLRGMSHRADAIAWWSSATLVGLVLIAREVDLYQFLREWSVACTLAGAGLVFAIQLARPDHPVVRAMSQRTLTWLGRASLPIFVWHVPVFVTVARHTTEWHWTARTALCLTLLGLIVVAANRWIEEPARRWLSTAPYFRQASAPTNSPAKPDGTTSSSKGVGADSSVAATLPFEPPTEPTHEGGSSRT